MQRPDSSANNYIRSFPKETIIFREGHRDAEMYFVLKGAVKLSSSSDNSTTLINQGGFFGEMSLLEGEINSSSAIASEDSILIAINKDNFNEIISKNPQLAFHIITGLCLRFRKLSNLANNQSTQEGPLANAIDSPEPTQDANEGSISESSSESLEMDTGSVPGLPQLELDETEVQITPEMFNKYCFTKDLVCPVCDHKFKTDLVRESRLRLRERTAELRPIYHDIEPLLYSVWVCPECYYAMKKPDFDKITEIQKRNLANQIDQRKKLEVLDFDKKSSYNFAFAAYRLAIDCCNSLGKKNIDERIAGLWLNMAWLYDDLEQSEAALESRKNSLAKYKNAYVFGTDRNTEQDQKIEYLIGKLSWELGNLKDAKEHFFKIINRRNGHQMLKQMARDGLDQLRDLS